MFDSAPGPEDSAHLWGYDEYDLAAMVDGQLEPSWRPGDPGYYHANCQYSQKRAFDTEYAANRGAGAIKVGVESHGGTYVPLQPYECPDGGHWHLTLRPLEPQEPKVGFGTQAAADAGDPAVAVARRVIERWTTDGWNASRDFIAVECAREAVKPIREAIEHAENHGDFIAIDDLKKLVYAEWELR